MAAIGARLFAPLLPAALAITLAGCSGTRFGDALSRSFPAGAGASPTPSVSPATPAAAASAATGTSPAPAGGGTPAALPGSGSRPVPAGQSAAPGGAPTAARPAAGSRAPSTAAAPSGAAATSAAPAPPPAPVAAPAPYRVTIQLPGADPAAPAEAVTRALRAAGVVFEVETIERLNAADTQTRSRSAPAAQGGGAVVRPAPAPR